MTTDIENRIIAAFIELLAATPEVADIVSARVYKSGDESHKAAYPSVTVAIPSCYAFDYKTGWYKATVTLAAEVNINDDKTMSVRELLAGELRGIAQSGKMEADLNKTMSARTPETALTVLDSELVDSFEDEIQNVRVRGISIAVLARPSTGKNKG